MPEPVTVWMVKLRPGGDLREVEGTLQLADDALVFVARKTEAETRVPFSDTSKVRRVIGSPVLVVSRRDGAGIDSHIAFYFVQPPPLPGTSARTNPPTSVPRHSSPRRQRRQVVGYLTARGRGTRTTIKQWVEEIRART
jgi:hypothetical protein